MKIAFISNFLNHHQSALAAAFQDLGCKYYFIAMEPVPNERISLGYDKSMNYRRYVIRAYEDWQNAEKVIGICDVVISSWDGRKLLKAAKGRVFIYTERIFKQTDSTALLCRLKNVIRSFKFRYYIIRYAKPEDIYLCVGAYAVRDYQRVGIKKKHICKFAYFPALSMFSSERSYVDDGVVKCLWVGRFVDWKKPEDAVLAVARLFHEGYPVKLVMIGKGPKEDKIKRMVAEQKADSCISFAGALPFEKVREYMHAADIFLFTSTQGEGWGVTLNEAMSEGMAVLASDGAGATTFLVKDGVNGVVYSASDGGGVYTGLKNLAENTQMIERYGKAAFQTMEQCWNARQAARNFIHLYECMEKNVEIDISDGPMSPA